MSKGRHNGAEKPPRKYHRKAGDDAAYLSVWLSATEWIVRDVVMPPEETDIPAVLIAGQSLFARLPRLRGRLGKALHAAWQSGTPTTVQVPTPVGMLPCSCTPGQPQRMPDVMICSLPLVLFTAPTPSSPNEGTDAGPDLPPLSPYLADIITSLPLLMMKVDLTGRVIAVNEPLHALSHEYVGETLPLASTEPHPTWHHWQDDKQVRWRDLPLARSLREGTPSEAFLRFRDPATGDHTSYLAKALPFFGETGAIAGASVMLLALTDAAHDAVQVPRQMDDVLMVLESIRDGVLLYDAVGKLWLMNPAAQSMMGWDKVHVDPLTVPIALRSKIYDMREENGRPLTQAQWPVNRALRGDSTDVVEISLKRLDGARINVGLSATPLYGAGSDQITGVLMVMRDMTQHRRFEKMREDFMNMASHELRTPLTALSLAQRIMQRHLERITDSDRLLELNDDLLNQIRILNHLVDNLLDMTGLTGGRFDLHVEMTDLAALTRDVVSQLHVMSKRTEHPIVLTGLSDPILAEVDPQRFALVIFNLLTNAMKFSPPKTPIEIEAHRFLHEDAPWVSIDITDYGIGIPPDQLPTLFDHVTEGGEGDKASGMGYSLYLSRAILRRHGGNITANSVYGFGSTFSVQIPALVPAREEARYEHA